MKERILIYYLYLIRHKYIQVINLGDKMQTIT